MLWLSGALLLAASVARGEGPAGTTYRGNPQRTASDGQPGPATPKVLWSFKAGEHFIAAPVVHKDGLYVSGVGAFNVSTLYRLSTDPAARQRVLWSKGTPYLKLPTVSSPAIGGDTLVFGDGMHQTDGAVLHCLRSERGQTLWQLEVPGTLVHLEGSPTLAGGRVYLGGGAAGVLCVDGGRLTLEGREMTPEAITKALDKKWAQLQARYEEEKKKDPLLAIPPSEDQLPRPSPLRVWQEGQQKWHVDAPVAVVGGRVLAASAYLDKEKAGDRALYCLDAANGKRQWRVQLPLNPWGGPSVEGDTVVVSGSSVNFDPQRLKKARGFVAAYDLASGKEKWKKTVPAGVLACVALTKDLAIATATDGKVRAFDLASGDRRWIYDGGSPFFAPAAVSGGVAYVGDLKGVVHAIDLTDGGPKWKLDLGANPGKLPGMIYGGPVVQGGRLYVATCNIAGLNENKPTVVVCIGER
jgi:outer membrane protein assembly factor BamB